MIMMMMMMITVKVIVEINKLWNYHLLYPTNL